MSANCNMAVPSKKLDGRKARQKYVRRKPRLTVSQILAWADAHHARTGAWPKESSGLVFDALGQTWSAVNTALEVGHRGLRGGSSLARLLFEHREVAGGKCLRPLTERQILIWADARYRRTGRWPKWNSGGIPETSGGTWSRVDDALKAGHRGLPGGSSLARLLFEKRGVRSQSCVPPLTEKQILKWADAHYRGTGQWPGCKGGAIADAPGETWANIDAALRMGQRGLPGGSSLPLLLQKKRGTRNPSSLPPLSEAKILAWAKKHFRRTGAYPACKGGAIADAPAETWTNVDAALRAGLRGLPGGSSLPHLLLEGLGAPLRSYLPPLSKEQILAWADRYFKHKRVWPTAYSERYPRDMPLEWISIEAALREGRRGLPRGSSLARLLAKERGVGMWRDKRSGRVSRGA
jgi:hypothetical protein